MAAESITAKEIETFIKVVEQYAKTFQEEVQR